MSIHTRTHTNTHEHTQEHTNQSPPTKKNAKVGHRLRYLAYQSSYWRKKWQRVASVPYPGCGVAAWQSIGSIDVEKRVRERIPPLKSRFTRWSNLAAGATLLSVERGNEPLELR